MTMKFKDKTRGGHDVRIYATDGCASHPIHGAIKDNGGWRPETWTLKGSVRMDGDIRGYDLIPLREPSEAAVEAACKAFFAGMAGTSYTMTRDALRAAYEIDGIGGGE